MAKKKTYAAEAKTIMNKYKTRLGEKFDKGDTLALEAMNKELAGLQEKQERSRVQNLVDNASPEQLSQFSQAFQAQNNKGPQQPGIPQGGPSGLAGGQAPQATGQPQFRGGGKLPMYQGGGRFPYGNQAYPQGQYAGNAFLDYTPQMLQDPSLARPYEQFGLIGGRSPLDPLQQGAQRSGAFPGRAGFDINQRSPGRAGFGLGQGVGSPTQIPGVTITGQRPTGATGVGAQGGGTGSPLDPNLGFPYAEQAGPRAGGGLPAIATPNPWQDPNIDLGQDYGFGNQGVNPQAANQTQALIAQNTPQQQQGGDPFKFRAPWFGAAATGLGSILGNRQLDIPALEGVEDVGAQQVAPRLVDYSRGREQVQRERDLSQAQIRSAAKGRGTQQGLTQTTIAGATGAQRVAGQQFTASQEAEANKNALIRNQASQFNAQQRAQASQTNLRSAMLKGQYERENALINAQRRQNQIAGVTGAISGYGRDLLSANYATGSLRLNEDPEYPIQQQNDAWWKRGLGVDADPFKRYTGPQRNIGQIQTRR